MLVKGKFGGYFVWQSKFGWLDGLGVFVVWVFVDFFIYVLWGFWVFLWVFGFVLVCLFGCFVGFLWGFFLEMYLWLFLIMKNLAP